MPVDSVVPRVGHEGAEAQQRLSFASSSGPASAPSLPAFAGQRPQGPDLRFRSGVVRIRSSTSVCLLHGFDLLPSGISGADDANAGDATELKWEFDEDLGRSYVSFPVDQ